MYYYFIAPPIPRLHYDAQTFSIQFESAGVYHVGTPTEQMLVSFEELLAFHAGIVGLLDSGPVYYVITNGEDAIRITGQELGSSLFGREIKKQWDRGMVEPGCLGATFLILKAFVYGVWNNLAYYKRWKKVAAL
ncbi:hypothetical protein BO79DRAFT_161699 [Aspergillus costaricaensis CBS 115574]|uniref:Uncharacterized protein n=1 Tax=Aspergillus costaricaensis CBS 115574 TaxID=1448317 RepID=A0ACD1HYL1_9EURO|nr:hypothetical protein BO79DRAFT_161699 [Aspergillus costaricaensis CBS 115574]RAK83123.1 hypothetical protein BO79DRAFT_161699 [Aspergillus costaricaensis CBS 115574]